MTPKEKAIELALNFCSPADIFRPNPASKRNAAKCVDEILNLPELIEVDAFIEHQIETFYREVKREIDNL